MIDQALKNQVFRLKGRLYTLTVLQLNSLDLSQFKSQLIDIIQQAPKMFSSTPIVLDCSVLPGDQLDLNEFCSCLRTNGLIPIAVQGGNAFINSLAESLGLALLNSSSTHDKLIDRNKNPSEPKAGVSEVLYNKLVTSPVRSGQQVVGKGGDLIITAPVSSGAELLADGNIHVYGALRGRALAGISGDTSTRIFCQSLHAELLSIAGYYRLSDAIEYHDGPCQIYLKDEQIYIAPLC